MLQKLGQHRAVEMPQKGLKKCLDDREPPRVSGGIQAPGFRNSTRSAAASISFWDQCAAVRAWAYLFCLLHGEELRTLICAFSFEIFSRSAATSFRTAADPGSSFDSLAGARADRRGAERGIHGGRRLATDDAADGSMEVKSWA